jgi:cell division cycle 20-like protein 1, cofactor of APC complex
VSEITRDRIFVFLSLFKKSWEKIGETSTKMEPSKKSKLNLPAGMESSLRIDPVPINFTPPPKITSPSKTTYSDRFIPCRSSSRLQNFNLVEKPSPKKEGSNEAYLRLLRAEMFGTEVGTGSPGSPVSPSKIFRYKTDHPSPASPLAVLGSGKDFGSSGSGEVSTPTKAPRKIPKSPHKVISLFQPLFITSLNLIVSLYM